MKIGPERRYMEVRKRCCIIVADEWGETCLTYEMGSAEAMVSFLAALGMTAGSD